MKEVIRSADRRIAALIDRQATQYAGQDYLGLERIARLLKTLGRPQDRLPSVLHVAGTNGKGSTCAFLRAALEAAGHKVHVFTSPHLVRYNERIRLAGSLIEDDLLAELMGRVLDANEDVGASLFEVNTAVAFLAFASTPADACIVEVGLGGRLDATNVIERPLVCGIAGLGLDHQQFLGRRMTGIAAEKAGIAKPGAPLVTQAYPPPLSDTIGAIADQVGARWLPRGGDWDAKVSRGRLRYRDARGGLDLPMPRLPGRHQALNAALAVAMLRHQDRLEVPDEALAEAMGRADWPARLQRLGGGPLLNLLPTGSELWLDGGHNPAAARLVAAHAKKAFGDGKPLHLLFASLQSKDARRVLSPFKGLAVKVHALPIADHDCRDPRELAAMAQALGFDASRYDSLEDALRAAGEPARVLIFGSLYLAGQALALNGYEPD